MNKEALEDAMKFLVRETGADVHDQKQLHKLANAINYANIDLWVKEPKTPEEDAWRRIFITKATYYFKRKMLHPIDDRFTIESMINHEHNEVRFIKLMWL